MEEEIFRDVPGFEGIYEASSLGYVRKVGGYKSRLKPHNYGSRKVIVSLYKDKRQYSFNIGDLIAGAFLGKKTDGYEIYYKNGNPADAKLSNICYSNLSEIEFNSLDRNDWRWVVGYEGLYAVSRQGEVRSMARRAGPRVIKGGPLIQHPIRSYQTVTLTKDGKSNRRTVHRLVARAFVPNPNNLPQINHKDENKSNNNVDNLEWCDAAYNLAYGSRQERINEKNGKHIMVLSRSGDIVGEFRSMEDASRSIGLYRGAVGKILRGDRRNTTNYLFRYKDGNLQKTN